MKKPILIIGSTQAHACVRSIDDWSPCINASAGTGGDMSQWLYMKFAINMEYRFLQYPRGLNKGGYSIPMYARLSVAHRGKTIVS